MKRLLLDTNIYGLLFTDKDFHIIHSQFENMKRFAIYGFDVIRRELKAAPSKVVDGVNIRAALLRAYSSFIKKEYSTDSLVNEVAAEYYKTYCGIGGTLPFQILHNDFLIVACASIHGIDIVVSEDNATMLNELSIRSYAAVNIIKKLNNPKFIGYEKFKHELV